MRNVPQYVLLQLRVGMLQITIRETIPSMFQIDFALTAASQSGLSTNIYIFKYWTHLCKLPD